MTAGLILAVLAGASAVWGSVTAGRIGSELQRRGVKVNWLLMRVQVIGWVSRYKKMTTAEQGRPGPLYWQFLTAMNLALVLAISALVARRSG
jgi:hypothetical protein